MPSLTAAASIFPPKPLNRHTHQLFRYAGIIAQLALLNPETRNIFISMLLIRQTIIVIIGISIEYLLILKDSYNRLFNRIAKYCL